MFFFCYLEYSKCISKEYKYTERMEKLKQKICVLNSQNEKALQNIEKSKNKILNLKERKFIEILI